MTPEKKVKIVGICGSLRAASVNRHVLTLASNVLPDGVELEVLEWRDVPVFDADDFSHGLPVSVSRLREKVRAADGVLLATPEYNFSIPGGLKNVLDWLSRGEDQPFAQKPVAIVSASPGPLGGARVQYDLRKVLVFLNALPLNKPEVFIGGAMTKFDPQSGSCTDPATRDFVKLQMSAFKDWISAVARMKAI